VKESRIWVIIKQRESRVREK